MGVIGDEVFEVDPWSVPERKLDLDKLAQTESVFALSNGHIGLRGNLDEGEPAGSPGTYLNGFYERRPLPYAETAYGNPESGETMINVTNGKVLRLLVDDEPFDLRYGTLERHERTLDLRAGVLRREVRWLSPAGQGVILRTTRLVSFVQRAVAAILYEVEPYDGPARVVVQSELIANEPVPGSAPTTRAPPPRCAAAARRGARPRRPARRARAQHARVGAAHRRGMDHLVDGPEGTVTGAECEPDLARVTVSTELEEGETLRIVKFLAYGWSSRRSVPAMRDQVDAALAAAVRTGWDGLLASQREYLDDFWRRADVELDGDPALQQATRFALFQVLQSAARSEGRAIPAKGLTGSGYDGHSFWDMETYTLPVLTYVAPRAARDALRWRHSTLDLARARAKRAEPAGRGVPVAHDLRPRVLGLLAGGHGGAAHQRRRRRRDPALPRRDRRRGVRARRSRSSCSSRRRGCGARSAITTRAAAFGSTASPAPTSTRRSPTTTSTRTSWRPATCARRRSRRRAIPRARRRSASTRRRSPRGATPPARSSCPTTRSCGSRRSRRASRATATGTSSTPRPTTTRCSCTTPTSSCTRARSSSRPTSSSRCTCAATASAPSSARATSSTTSAITVRDSSLSACIQAIMAAEVGHAELAYDYLAETAFIDLRDLAFNTRDGIHLASLAGCWLVAVAGFGGMRDHGATLEFSPRLPAKLDRLSFRLTYRGRLLCVTVGRARRATSCSTATRSTSATTASASRSTAPGASCRVRSRPRRRARARPSRRGASRRSAHAAR